MQQCSDSNLERLRLAGHDQRNESPLPDRGDCSFIESQPVRTVTVHIGPRDQLDLCRSASLIDPYIDSSVPDTSRFEGFRCEYGLDLLDYDSGLPYDKVFSLPFRL